ncbi:Superoxide dismutase [Cu-Zn], chloroplastic [Apis cerana cerana]|uniref:Superoxide dismutase [Cu-Zn] n=2 Tax=Apis cerana TaxID=7461 RepID=A0A2A3E4W5_APICC|nr:Superoxide dismutase [Cu-Zn], chloroplastic [Apis cerana cerana]
MYIEKKLFANVDLIPHNAQNRNVTGKLTIVQNDDNSVVITGKICGLSMNGLHGFHIHEKGNLQNGCTSTGSHFNPENVTHGGPNSLIRHVGDLGNIQTNINGEADVYIKDFIISLTGKNSILGRAIVVHSDEDDLGNGNSHLSKTTGNSGSRWACGIIGIN